MVDPTQYLNYQVQIHDVTYDGYDDQRSPNGGDVQQGEDDVMPIVEADEIATETAPHILLNQPPFLGGPLDTTLLSSYAEYVALRMWFNLLLYYI